MLRPDNDSYTLYMHCDYDSCGQYLEFKVLEDSVVFAKLNHVLPHYQAGAFSQDVLQELFADFRGAVLNKFLEAGWVGKSDNEMYCPEHMEEIYV